MAQTIEKPERANSHKRFYQLEMRNRPALLGDIGSLLRIQGLLVGGAGAQVLLTLPGTKFDEPLGVAHQLTLEQWTDFLERSDDPELLMPAKAFHRKVRYEISGFVQQKIWAADDFTCAYCGVRIGKAPLTIDHFIALENGGKNNTSNYITACKRCNKDKGSEDTRTFCDRRSLSSYDALVRYLATRVLP